MNQCNEDHRSHDVVLISQFVDGDLDARTFLAVSRQMAQCRRCRQVAQEFRAAGDLIRGGRDPIAVPADVDRRVRDNLYAREGRRREKLRFRGAPGVVATVAAGVLLFISSGYLRSPSPEGTPVPNHSAISRPTSTAGKPHETRPAHPTARADRSKHVLISEIQQTPPMHNMPTHPDPI